jgi:hypothetical protein
MGTASARVLRLGADRRTAATIVVTPPAIGRSRTAVIEQLLAAVVLAACVAMLARMAIGERRRRRLDAALREAGHSARRLWLRLRRRAPSSAEAQRAAQDAIRRARDRRKLH